MASTTFDVGTRCIIQETYKMLKLGVLFLEGHGSKIWKDYTCIYMSYQFSYIDDWIDTSQSRISAALKRVLYRSTKSAISATNIIL